MTRRELKLNYNEYCLQVCLDMQVGLGGDKWPAADLFCHLITSNQWIPKFTSIFDHKTVLDLGSGTGITGILLDKVYNTKEIIITDLESHIEHIKYNILLNKEDRKVTTACALDWFQPKTSVDKKIDIILAFECVYKESLYEPFINTLDELSHSKSLIFLGMTRNFMKPSFFKLLRQHGYMYTLVPQDNMPNEYRSNGSLRDTGLLICSKCNNN